MSLGADKVGLILFHAWIIFVGMFAESAKNQSHRLRSEWFREQSGIFQLHGISKRVSLANETLDDMQVVVVPGTIVVDPGIRAEVDDIHDQRVGFPMAD